MTIEEAMRDLEEAIENVVRVEEGNVMVTNFVVAYEFVDLAEEREPGMTVSTGVNYVALPTGSGTGALGMLSIIETKLHDSLVYDEED